MRTAVTLAALGLLATPGDAAATYNQAGNLCVYTTGATDRTIAAAVGSTCDAAAVSSNPTFGWEPKSILAVASATPEGYLTGSIILSTVKADSGTSGAARAVAPAGVVTATAAVAVTDQNAASCSSVSTASCGSFASANTGVNGAVTMTLQVAQTSALTHSGTMTMPVQGFATVGIAEDWATYSVTACDQPVAEYRSPLALTPLVPAPKSSTPDVSCTAGASLAAGVMKQSMLAVFGGAGWNTGTGITALDLGPLNGKSDAETLVTNQGYVVVRSQMDVGNIADATVTFNNGVNFANLGTASVYQMVVAFNGQALVTDFASTVNVGALSSTPSVTKVYEAKESQTYTRNCDVKVSAVGAGLKYYIDVVVPLNGTYDVAANPSSLIGAASTSGHFIAYDPTITHYPTWPLPVATASADDSDPRSLCLVARYITMACINLLAAFAVVGVIFTWCYFAPCEWWCHPDLEEGVWDWNVKERKVAPVRKAVKKQPKIKHIVYESETDEEIIEAKRIEHHEIGDDEEIVVRKKGKAEIVSESRAVDPELFASINETIKAVNPGLKYSGATEPGTPAK